MRLARIRRRPGAAVELAAAVDGGLLPLPGITGYANADPVAALAALGEEELHTAIDRLRRGGAEMLSADDVVFEPPVAECSKVCCFALNYAAHARESRLDVPPAPVLFFKPPSALVGHRAEVRPPARTTHVEHEVELAVVIGRQCRGVDPAHWRSVVAGYTIINDMTARDLQLASARRNEPWDHAKAFDTFAPLGPYLVTAEDVPDPHDLRLTLSVSGEVRQEAYTAAMVYRIPQLLADLTDGMTLCPGDVIATGTTAGIAPVRDGDVMHATVAGLGTLTNRVRWRH
jgi:5-oxopent-3-ene-1,2,5-tricarboxylate decarboxylase / 2-hydroxyhepta-2,4-diene-1,7-dioate isomerase